MKLFSALTSIVLNTILSNSFALANTEKKSIAVPSFDALDLSGKLEVKLTVGAKQSIEIETDAEYLDSLDIKVVDRVLQIGSKKSTNWSSSFKNRRAIVRIQVPSITSIDISGACTLVASGFSGGALEIDGSGAVESELTGNIDELTISISGAAEIKAFELKAQNVDLDVSGAAQIEVYAVKTIKSDVSGAASVTYRGTPAIVKSEISGMGNMKQRG